MAFKHPVIESNLPSGLGLHQSEGGLSLGAWFLGPKGENEELLISLVLDAVRSHCQDRRKVFPEDPRWVTEETKNSPEYQQAVRLLRQELNGLLAKLDGSVPFFSYRYQGHMLWDVTLPGVVGYFAAMLYNQNNVAAEASPLTTWLELEVGRDLCRMLGFDPERPGVTSPVTGRSRTSKRSGPRGTSSTFLMPYSKRRVPSKSCDRREILRSPTPVRPTA